jgi:hypothetical protein
VNEVEQTVRDSAREVKDQGRRALLPSSSVFGG